MNGTLRFLICGSVDDGKSTLLGHLLYDGKMIYDDQRQALIEDSRNGSRAGDIDYSLLLDGLEDERAQGITITAAYRYFSTSKRRFIAADTPGHEEYTRNMAIGAAFASLAVILIDAQKGVLIQTKRHTRICNMMGIRDYVFAVNKMDLIDYSKERFEQIENQIKEYIKEYNIKTYKVIPVSAVYGDNINKTSQNTLWYKGESLLEYLEQIEPYVEDTDMCMMIAQRISRPDSSYRGIQGNIYSGTMKIGDEISVYPTKEKAIVRRIVRGLSDVEAANKGDAVSICLDRDIEVSRGYVLGINMDGHILCSNSFTADIIWFDDENLIEGRRYILKRSGLSIPVRIKKIEYKTDCSTGDRIIIKEGHKNDILYCSLETDADIDIQSFNKNKLLGSFILIDMISNLTSGCGMVDRVDNREVVWQTYDITRQIRAQNLGQTPCVYWFTGLSGSGKSTLANYLERYLVSTGRHTMVLDGDNIRHGISCNLSFSAKDRRENIRRIAHVARLLNDAGIIVIVAAISPYEEDREMAADIIGENYRLIYVSTPISVCMERDTKGIYKKAMEGTIRDFTGISSQYEVPKTATISIDTTDITVTEAIDIIVRQLPYM